MWTFIWSVIAQNDLTDGAGNYEASCLKKTWVHSCQSLWCDLGRHIHPKASTIYIRETKVGGQLYRACGINITKNIPQEERPPRFSVSQVSQLVLVNTQTYPRKGNPSFLNYQLMHKCLAWANGPGLVRKVAELGNGNKAVNNARSWFLL